MSKLMGMIICIFLVGCSLSVDQIKTKKEFCIKQGADNILFSIRKVDKAVLDIRCEFTADTGKYTTESQ